MGLPLQFVILTADILLFLTADITGAAAWQTSILWLTFYINFFTAVPVVVRRFAFVNIYLSRSVHSSPNV